MANSLFLAYKQEQVGDAAGPGHGAVDWEADTLKCFGLDTADDTVNINTDQDLDDLVGAGIVVTGTLASKTAVASSNTMTQDAADLTFTAVTGDQFENLVIYKDSGVAATSLLIVYFDTFTSGMPVTPNGGDIVVQWNASGIWNW